MLSQLVLKKNFQEQTVFLFTESWLRDQLMQIHFNIQAFYIFHSFFMNNFTLKGDSLTLNTML